MRKLGIPPESLQPDRYSGPKVNIVPCVEAKRRPLTLDRDYSLLTQWRVGYNATTGDEGEIWQLVRYESNGDATWRRIDFTGSSPGLETITVDDITAPGVNPVDPDGAGNITVGGAAVAAHSIPVETRSRALNAYNIEIQVASDITGAPGNTNAAGLSSYDDTIFVVDANGFVTLVGGSSPPLQSVDVDFNTAPGTDPVLVTAAGVISIYGNTVTNATNANAPVATHSRAANQFHIDVQLATEITGAPADPYDAGLCSFDDTAFAVDANGFVTLVGGSTPPLQSVGVDANTAPGTDPVLATAGGLVTVSGAAVAAHSVPVETHSRAANAYNVEVQVASAVTGAPGNTNAVGLCQFDDTAFSVDSNGYVTSATSPGGDVPKLLATATLSGTVNVDFEDYIDSTYDLYMFLLDSIKGSTTTGVYINTSANGGTSYDQGATDYTYNYTGSDLDGYYIIPSNAGASAGTNDDTYARIYLYSPSKTNYTAFSGTFFQRSGTNTLRGNNFFGTRNSAAIVDAVRFLATAGNLASGTIKLYGMLLPS